MDNRCLREVPCDAGTCPWCTKTILEGPYLLVPVLERVLVVDIVRVPELVLALLD